MPKTAEQFAMELENVDAYVKWLNQIKKGTGDARPLWIALRPKITEFVEQQFDPVSNAGKRWKKLTPSYKSWKIRKGFSSGIGVMTGKLTEAAGSGAHVKMKKKSMSMSVDNSKATDSKGTKYAKWFHAHKDGSPKRPIYDNVVMRLNSFISTDIEQSKSGVGFTHRWLIKSLRVPKG